MALVTWTTRLDNGRGLILQLRSIGRRAAAWLLAGGSGHPAFHLRDFLSPIGDDAGGERAHGGVFAVSSSASTMLMGPWWWGTIMAAKRWTASPVMGVPDMSLSIRFMPTLMLRANGEVVGLLSILMWPMSCPCLPEAVAARRARPRTGPSDFHVGSSFALRGPHSVAANDDWRGRGTRFHYVGGLLPRQKR